MEAYFPLIFKPQSNRGTMCLQFIFQDVNAYYTEEYKALLTN